MTRCLHCGRDKDEAYQAVSYHCAPPFEVRMHDFGPVAVAPPSQRQLDAKVVREALEAAAIVEPDTVVANRLLNLAASAHTETLAYIRRLLK